MVNAFVVVPLLTSGKKPDAPMLRQPREILSVTISHTITSGFYETTLSFVNLYMDVGKIYTKLN